jgi:putative acetyltransferase
MGFNKGSRRAAFSLTGVTNVTAMYGWWLRAVLLSSYHDPMLIRSESGTDQTTIAEINRLAFGGDHEVELIDRLRAEGQVLSSLLAVDAYDRILGHILFSRVVVHTRAGDVPVASLGPMCVLPQMQRHGIGSALVRHGIKACRRLGEAAVIVVGHPRFYPEMGFSRHVVEHLESPFAGEAFMGLELVPGSLSAIRGEVIYPAAFAVFA